MTKLRLLRWSGSVLSPRTRPCSIQYQCRHRRRLLNPIRCQSTAALHIQEQDESAPASDDIQAPSSSLPTNQKTSPMKLSTELPKPNFRQFPSPPPSRAASSPTLSALHARISLPSRVPLETLARCLIDPSADPHPHYNNASLALLGYDILGYYTSEAVLCRFPRLPTEIVFAAMTAYVGPKTLTAITREWGIEYAAAPGGEVDPGHLQFLRKEAGNASSDGTGTQLKELTPLQDPENDNDLSVNRPNPSHKGWRRGMSSRTVYDDYFGNEITSSTSRTTTLSTSTPVGGVTATEASNSFIRALFGALYLHTGLRQTKAFYTSHILSRHLDISSLFSFKQPTRDLARLCAREGFEAPVARILSETGRKSRHPVFIVGVFSGREKLGEGSGGSLDEARFRASVSALKGWYLYSPLVVRVPSEAVRGKEWVGGMVDWGEVIV